MLKAPNRAYDIVTISDDLMHTMSAFSANAGWKKRDRIPHN